MKVMLVHMEFPPILGGGGRYTQNLTKGLSDSGVETILITSGDSDSEEKINKKLTIKRFRVLKELYAGIGDVVKAVNIIVEQLQDESPDLLHTEHSLETLVGQIANSNFGLPHVVTHHKTPAYDNSMALNGKWSLYNFVNSSTEVNYIQSSLAFKNSLLQSGIDNNLISVIYPGVNREIFKKLESSDTRVMHLREKLQLNDDDLIVLIPCLVRKRKGLDFLGNALSKLVLPKKKIKIIITGLPKSMEEKKMMSRIESVVSPNIIVEHEEFDDKDMPILYNLADITILGSKAEGLGISLLEAMACGCPVIGTNVIGINEVIEDSYNGRLCEYDNSEELLDAIQEIAENKDVRNKYIKNAYLTLDNKFNLKTQSLKHVEIYKSMIKKVKQSSGGVLYRINKKKLEIYLAKHSSYGYVLPKGGKEPSETWLETAIREVSEETGYEVKVPSHSLGLIKWSFEKEGTTVYKECMFYGFELSVDTTQGGQKLEEGEQVKKGEWFAHKEAIKEMAHETEKEAVMKLISNIEI